MLIQALGMLVGLVLLYFGADWVVRGAARLARAVGVSTLLIGLTVVSLGTSAPELVVSIVAAARHQGELVVGNVLGSNVLNIALILGAAALIFPVGVHLRLIQREIPFMIALSVVMVVLGLNGVYGRGEGALLLAGLVGYLLYMARASRRPPPENGLVLPAFEEAVSRFDGDKPSGWRSAGRLAAGLAVLLVGANLLVAGSLFFATHFGVSEVVVGITIVALGTSLPELATSVVAALRRETDIAVGNAVGSNIFNILAVLGAASVFYPLGVPSGLIRFEFPVMLLASVVILPLALTGRRFQIGRWEGVILLSGYVIFTAALVIRAARGVVVPGL